MIIKLILLVVVGIFVYRLLGGTFPPLKREKHKEKKVDRGDDFSKMYLLQIAVLYVEHI